MSNIYLFKYKDLRLQAKDFKELRRPLDPLEHIRVLVLVKYRLADRGSEPIEIVY